MLVTIPVLAITITTASITSKNLTSHFYEDHVTLSNTIANSVSDYMNKAYVLTEELISNHYVRQMDPKMQDSAVKDTMKRNPYFDLFCIQDMKGDQTARTTGKLANRADRWWFKESVSKKKPFVTKSYLTVNDDSDAINSIIFPIFDEKNNMVGVMDADLKLDELQKMVEKYSTDLVYAYVVDGEGAVIAHPDREKVQEIYNYKTSTRTVRQKDSSNKVIKDENGAPVTKVENIEVPEKLAEITLDALAGNSGKTEYKDLNGEIVISAYQTIKLPGESDNWAVITVEKKSDALALVYKVQKISYIIGAGMLFLVIIITYLLSSKFTKPLINLAKITEKASSGDLTAYSDYKSKDEIGLLSDSFNAMLDNMKNLIRNINETSSVVSNSSQSLLASTEQTSSSISEVAQSITEVASTMEKGADSSKEGVMAANELSKELDLVVQRIKESIDTTNKVYEISNTGFQTINKLEAKNLENGNVSRAVFNVINELSEKANSIGGIVETITSISEQTNLLALNAAIEAARAGEAGKGFSVVAEEVRKLSENTAQSTNNVKSIITSIQKDIEVALTTIKTADTVLKDQNEAVDNTRDTFKEINASIVNVVEKIDYISESLKSVDECRNKLLSVVQEVSSISGGIADAAQNVSGATEEQNAEMEEINALSEELNRMAQTLESEIRKFKIQ
ncbi:methyl-accepting chemotaxis protein [Clostridium sp. MSJ-11]|uniref:Methyl-accepting chemotaxis protein n=1 Tax=Clostridium mobile TaxID=2841512 RepID=A0ABS6EHZ1_9CLOT|nr:methyl-accepting chemotaxis protein [Clostridium mobile]MBU5484819.1 methyl-accepting chemotaxis protein [Clostridium mobile]